MKKISLKNLDILHLWCDVFAAADAAWRNFIACFSMFATLIVTMTAQTISYLMVPFLTVSNAAILYPFICIIQFIIGGG